MITSGSSARLSWRPAVAKPVATGGCACTTAFMSGRKPYTVVCMAISLVPCRRPEILLPFISTRIRSSGCIRPLHTPVGVARIRSASNRMVILPSLAATHPFLKTKRPIWQISSRYSRSVFTITRIPIVPDCVRFAWSARHTSYDGADGSTPHVPALPGIHHNQRPRLPLLQRGGRSAPGFPRRFLPARRRLHPPLPLQHHHHPPAQFRTLHRHHHLQHARRQCGCLHEPGHPYADFLRRQVEYRVSPGRVVAPGHGGLPARRPVPHPDEFLGALRSRRPGGRALRVEPHAGDLFHLHGGRLLSQL